MGEITTVGLDIAKAIFVAHGADAAGKEVLRRNLRREEVRAVCASVPPRLVGLEACAPPHCWARKIAVLGLSCSSIGRVPFA